MSYRTSSASDRNARAQKECDAFNEEHPVGTVVAYWRGLHAGEPDGEGRTCTVAQLVGGAPVVWIEGCRGCVALTHIEV